MKFREYIKEQVLDKSMVGQKRQGDNIIIYYDLDNDGEPELKVLYSFEKGKLKELERSKDVSEWKPVRKLPEEK